MTSSVLPVLFALFLWWFSTGVILYLDGLSRATHGITMLVSTLILILALFGIAQSSRDASVWGAYQGFACGLLVWGWHEISFLLGYVTGPRTAACPPACSGLVRLMRAVETIAYHEAAIAVTAVLVVALTADGVNKVGAFTFVILWWMRLSAKINVFLGVPNLAEDWLPEHLRYLESYFRRRPMNVFFPFAVTVSTLAAFLLVRSALEDRASPGETVGLTLLAVITALAVIEHWFLVLPLPTAKLWSWGLASHAQDHEVQSSTMPDRPLEAVSSIIVPVPRRM